MEEKPAEERRNRQLNPPRRFLSLSISSDGRRRRDNQLALVCYFTDVPSLASIDRGLILNKARDWVLKTERKMASPEDQTVIERYLSPSRFRLFPHLRTPPIRAGVDKRWQRRSSNKDKLVDICLVREEARLFVFALVQSGRLSFLFNHRTNRERERERKSITLDGGITMLMKVRWRVQRAATRWSGRLMHWIFKYSS